MAPLNILIVGCGIAGPILATFLLLSPTPAHEKPHITILERAPSPRVQGQGIDIRGAGLTIIRKLGLESTIRAAVTGEEGVKFVDSSNRIWAMFGADRTGKIETGTADVEIMRGRLVDICVRKCKAVSKEVESEGGKGVEWMFGDYLDRIEQDDQKVHVRLAKSGKELDFDLVCGADGLHSQTRKLVFGEKEDEERVRRLEMYTCFFTMPRSETDGIWRRWFNAPGRRSIWIRPSDQKDRSSAFVYVINHKDARLRELAGLGPRGVQAQKALMQEYFRDVGWESERVLKEMNAADDFYYDMVAQVKMDRWSKGRVVLLGDAGYCASPISGMGTTLALTGAYNLAGAFSRHSEDHTAAFVQYAESMHPVVTRAQKLPFGGPPYGAPHLINPETTWGIWMMRGILAFFYYSGLAMLLMKLARGKPASALPVEEFGFKQLREDNR